MGKFQKTKKLCYKIKETIKLYFFERCSRGPKSKDFWPTITFLSSKTAKNSADIILMENNSLVSDQAEVLGLELAIDPPPQGGISYTMIF